MAVFRIKNRSSILGAIEEYDRLGQTAFLSKYGFGKSRGYFKV